MPGVPMEMPSETVMVLKVTALPPAASAPGGRLARQLADVHVAGCQIAPGRGDADLRLVEIGFAEADGAQHRARRRLLDAIDHQPRIAARITAARMSRIVFGFLLMVTPSRSVEQIAIEAAHALGLRADRRVRAAPCGFHAYRSICSQLRVAVDEALQEKRPEDGARERRRGDIVEVGDLAGKLIVVSRPNGSGHSGSCSAAPPRAVAEQPLVGAE